MYGLVMFQGIMIVTKYRDIQTASLIPFARKAYSDGYRLYHNNDPKHTSWYTRGFCLQQHHLVEEPCWKSGFESHWKSVGFYEELPTGEAQAMEHGQAQGRYKNLLEAYVLQIHWPPAKGAAWYDQGQWCSFWTLNFLAARQITWVLYCWYLQKGRNPTCVPTEDNIEGSTHKSEGTTEAHGQGCGVPDPLCTVWWGLHQWNRTTLEDQDQRTQMSSGHGWYMKCQRCQLDEDQPEHGLGAAHVVGRSNQWRERKIKESVHVRTKTTYNLDSGSSLSPVWNSLIGHWQV